MKKTTFVATAMGLALVFGTAMKSEAFCLLGCDDSTTVDQKAAGRDIRENSDNVSGQSAKGVGNQAMHDVKDAVVKNNDSATATGGMHDANGTIRGEINANTMAVTGGLDQSHNNTNINNSTNNFGR